MQLKINTYYIVDIDARVKAYKMVTTTYFRFTKNPEN